MYIGLPIEWPEGSFNHAHFCMFCGDVFAREVLDGERLWLSLGGCCSRCQPATAQRCIPGSIWDTYLPRRNLGLPLELLHREILLMIKQIERSENGKS